MADFRFEKLLNSNKWVIMDPKRANRPNVGNKAEQVCPFCVGMERGAQEYYRVGGRSNDGNWRIRVIENKFPFAPIHEIVIHSPDHHKNFDELSLPHVELILRTYRARYLLYGNKGQVYIFHNRGIAAGESIPHPHTQLTVIPNDIEMEIPYLDMGIYKRDQRSKIKNQSQNLKLKNNNFEFIKSIFQRRNEIEEAPNFEFIETENFMIFCPAVSQWPDEVWVAPRRKNTNFGEISETEIGDFAFCLQRVISVFDLRYGHEFPFNFYIYPGKNWYLRLIPRVKILGGFEMGTGVIVNTQDPKKTFSFLEEHFFDPDLYKIRMMQKEDYWKSV